MHAALHDRRHAHGSFTTCALQAEPGKTPISVGMPALLAPVFSRLAVFSTAKRPMWRVFKKKISQIQAKEKKLRPFPFFFSAVDMDQTAAKNRFLILAISQWRTQKESPTSGVFPYSRCGPI